MSIHRPQPINRFQDGRPQFQDGRPQFQDGRLKPQNVRPQYQDGGDQYQDEEYSDYEDEKPDRLTELLLSSKFSCAGQKDGYYADEFVKCEVFHFCQDGIKHSWLCPNGAAFHQVNIVY